MWHQHVSYLFVIYRGSITPKKINLIRKKSSLFNTVQRITQILWWWYFDPWQVFKDHPVSVNPTNPPPLPFILPLHPSPSSSPFILPLRPPFPLPSSPPPLHSPLLPSPPPLPFNCASTSSSSPSSSYSSSPHPPRPPRPSSSPSSSFLSSLSQ